MTASGTALEDVIEALVTTLAAALSVPVHDGRPISQQPDRSFVVVGADRLPTEGDREAEVGSVEAVYAGMTGQGQRARTERLTVHCLAVYRATSEADARKGAIALESQAAAALVAAPKLGLANAYDAIVARIDRTRIIPTGLGPICALTFTVMVMARLV